MKYTPCRAVLEFLLENDTSKDKIAWRIQCIGCVVEDADIIVQARLGNKGAYRELLRKYAPFAVAVAFARSGNREAARQAVADAFVQAAKEISALPDAAPIAPWLGSIVRSAAARRPAGAGRTHTTIEAAGEKVKKAVADAGGPAAVSPEERNRLAMSAFESLPDEAREALCMLHTCTRNYAEIAGIMAMEAGQVDEHLVKAREQVAAILSALFQ